MDKRSEKMNEFCDELCWPRLFGVHVEKECEKNNTLYNLISRLMQSGAVMISPLMCMMQWKEQGKCPASQFVPVWIQERNKMCFNIQDIIIIILKHHSIPSFHKFACAFWYCLIKKLLIFNICKICKSI